MAGVKGRAPSGEVALAAATAKTILQIVAATNHRVLVPGFYVEGKGIVVTDQPIKIDILRQTTAGTMSAGTPVKNHDGDDETLQTTTQVNATAEPTAGDVLETHEVHPQTGIRIFYPFDSPIAVKGGGRLAIRGTAPQAVTVAAGFDFEE